VRREWSSDWEVAYTAARRRQFRILLSTSLAFHVLAVSALAFVPEPEAPPLSRVISVDLLSLPAPAAPKPAPVLSKPAPAPPEPAPAPPKKIVLPKKAPAVRSKPKAAKPVIRRPRPKELDYDEALSNLRSEMGESEPQAPPAEVEMAASEGGEVESAVTEGESGATVNEEARAWVGAVKRHLRSRYVTLPEFLDRSLVTMLQVLLTAEGEVLGAPEVVLSSGDLFWDDNAIRTVMSASPLPPPPEAGSWTFTFPSEGR